MHSLIWAWKVFLLSSGILAQALEPKTLDERHWDYTHTVLRMESPQPLTCGAPYSTNTKHSLLLHPKEKEVNYFHGEGMLPSVLVTRSSSQPHHFPVVCMELSVPFESPPIHINSGNLF